MKNEGLAQREEVTYMALGDETSTNTEAVTGWEEVGEYENQKTFRRKLARTSTKTEHAVAFRKSGATIYVSINVTEVINGQLHYWQYDTEVEVPKGYSDYSTHANPEDEYAFVIFYKQ